GKVIRVDPEGKGFVLLDSPFQEIHALRFDDKGQLYVAALSARPGGGSSPTTTDTALTGALSDPTRIPVPSVSAEITSISIVDVGSSGTSASPREDRRSPKGAVYRIAPDGAWDQLRESREDSPYAPTLDPCRPVLVASGNKGK